MPRVVLPPMLLTLIVGASCLTKAFSLLADEPNTLPSDDAPRWSIEAVSNDRNTAERAVSSLRRLGPAGLAAFCEVHARELADLRTQPSLRLQTNSAAQRLSDTIDQIAGQRDAAWAELYWHTDFATALATARRENKPILTLRLLGKLTDELSCANSRFFRTTLYSDPAIADRLRQDFVLHWQSVRPVPKITIDFGDGRKLERTITGNSAHCLEPHGTGILAGRD